MVSILHTDLDSVYWNCMKMKLHTREEKRTFLIKYMKSKNLDIEKNLWALLIYLLKVIEQTIKPQKHNKFYVM